MRFDDPDLEVALNPVRLPVVNVRAFTPLIITDVGMTVAGVIFLLVVRAAFSDSNYMLLLAGLVALSGLCMAAGLVPLRRGRVVSACNFLSIANWVVALGATKIAPFSLPILITASLVPARWPCRSAPAGRFACMWPGPSPLRRGWRPLAAVSPPRTAVGFIAMSDDHLTVTPIGH